jgi:hypothetical protein
MMVVSGESDPVSKVRKVGVLRRPADAIRPFRQVGGSGSLEDVAAIEVTVEIEMIMDRGMLGHALQVFNPDESWEPVKN